MAENLKHECGIAMVRLLKPLDYYHKKYGTWQYGLHKLYLLMEKQHNRGQEGAGLGAVKLKATPGNEYIFRERALGSGAITEVFEKVNERINKYSPDEIANPSFAEKNIPYAAELFVGHLRYSTTGRTSISYVHPLLRRNNWPSRSLALAGNFSMTNTDELFNLLLDDGQHPRDNADNFVMLESMGHYLDREVQYQYDKIDKENLSGCEISDKIAKNLDIASLLKRSSEIWDGGYAICGMTGSGDSFVLRDPWGIRTAFYYCDDETIVVASERPVIQTAFNLTKQDIKELHPGEALIIKKDGRVKTEQILQPKPNITPCSFERIYFSRGSDFDIYRERKKLGELLIPEIVETIKGDFDNTVFSFIPNTAEVAYFGMLEALENYFNKIKTEEILQRQGELTPEEIQVILAKRVRAEKVAIKDIKLRTFIAQGKSREELATHVYDVTYGSIRRNQDQLVIIDDSIVRGTTLKNSIIKILDRLEPKKIIIVSSSPQIRYPDCYGIDMTKMSEFIAFRAAIALLNERGLHTVIKDVYEKCLAQRNNRKEDMVNYVKEIYAPFTNQEISDKIADLLVTTNIKSEVKIVYQNIDNLHKACPEHKGDWYFSGNYPTPGGNRVVNEAFINYIEKEENKTYQYSLSFRKNNG